MERSEVTGPVTRVTCAKCGWRDCKCPSASMGGPCRKCDRNPCKCGQWETPWWALSACLAFVPVGCGPTPGPGPLEPPGPAGSACVRFCDVLDRGDCPGEHGSPGADEVRGSADDVPCSRVCQDLQDTATYRGDHACLDKATTCQQAESCMFGE